jgi:hypothetical protein
MMQQQVQQQEQAQQDEQQLDRMQTMVILLAGTDSAARALAAAALAAQGGILQQLRQQSGLLLLRALGAPVSIARSTECLSQQLAGAECHMVITSHDSFQDAGKQLLLLTNACADRLQCDITHAATAGGSQQPCQGCNYRICRLVG